MQNEFTAAGGGAPSAPAATAPPLPVEHGRPRVQRLVKRLAPVHLETEPPSDAAWTLSIVGLVERELSFSIDALREMGEIETARDFHCVWGWSCPQARWCGVPAGVVLDAAGLSGSAAYVRFEASESPYAACVSIAQARAGLFATRLDGDTLPSEHGGPLRWLQPANLWGYKGVKWVTRVVVTDRLEPGLWETCVGDVEGEVPAGLLARFAARAGLASEAAR